MSVIFSGVKKLDLNNYKELTILEDNDDFILEFMKEKIKIDTVSLNIQSINNIDSWNKVLEIVKSYLNSFKINEITSLLDKKMLLIYGNNKDKLLKLQLSNDKMMVIYNIILNKYLQDRYNYFWSEYINLWEEDIEKIKFNFDYNTSGYENIDEIFDIHDNISLKIDNNGKLLDYEIKFVEDLLYNKLWKIGIKATYKYVFDEDTGKFLGYNVKCGYLKIFIPFDEDKLQCLFILNIINNYNNQLDKINNDIKKRQLKMEGF